MQPTSESCPWETGPCSWIGRGTKRASSRNWDSKGRDRRTDRELLAEEDFRLAHERIFFDVDTRASAFILFAMGTVLFPTTSGDKMNVVLAEFVQNDDRIREYAWCEAVVAYL